MNDAAIRLLSEVSSGSSKERKVCVLAYADRPVTRAIATALARDGWQLVVLHHPRAVSDARHLYLSSIEWGVKVALVPVERVEDVTQATLSATGVELSKCRLLVFVGSEQNTAQAYTHLLGLVLPIWKRAQDGVAVAVPSPNFTRSVGRLDQDLVDGGLWAVGTAMAVKYREWDLRWYCVVPLDDTGEPAHETAAKAVVQVVGDPSFCPSGGVVFCSREPHTVRGGVLGVNSPVQGYTPPNLVAEQAPSPVAVPAAEPMEPAQASASQIQLGPIEAELHAAFQTCFGMNSGSLEAAQIGSHPGWDSLGHIMLIMELQHRFKVEFSATEIPMLGTYASIRDTLRRKRAESARSPS